MFVPFFFLNLIRVLRKGPHFLLHCAVYILILLQMFCTVLCLVPPLLKEMLSRGQHYYSALSARISDEENTTSDADISPVIPVRHIYG